MAFKPKHDQNEVLRSPFDYDTHNETFKCYCEVIVRPDGTIEYAVPSHRRAMEAICRDMGIDPIRECPEEYYYDYLSWLEEATGCIPVWYDTFHPPKNDKQLRALRRLQMHGCCNFKGACREFLKGA